MRRRGGRVAVGRACVWCNARESRAAAGVRRAARGCCGQDVHGCLEWLEARREGHGGPSGRRRALRTRCGAYRGGRLLSHRGGMWTWPEGRRAGRRAATEVGEWCREKFSICSRVPCVQDTDQDKDLGQSIKMADGESKVRCLHRIGAAPMTARAWLSVLESFCADGETQCCARGLGASRPLRMWSSSRACGRILLGI